MKAEAFTDILSLQIENIAFCRTKTCIYENIIFCVYRIGLVEKSASRESQYHKKQVGAEKRLLNAVHSCKHFIKNYGVHIRIQSRMFIAADLQNMYIGICEEG